MIPMKNEYFENPPHLFIAALGDEAQNFAYNVMNKLRLEGIRTEMDFSDKSLKSQMRRSNKLKSYYTLIVGHTEIQQKSATLRNMNTGEQSDIVLTDIDTVVDALKNIEYEDARL
jgi:histidyl-tRNA synthetase